MIALMLVEPNSGGQIQQIATTFGVDWPHLIAQMISFSIVCFLLHRFAYKPILKVLEERRLQIAQGIAETERIRAELAQAEAKCRDIILQANVQATEVDRRRSLRCRSRATGGDSESHRRGRTDPDEIARGRRPGARPYAHRAKTRGWRVSSAECNDANRQDLN